MFVVFQTLSSAVWRGVCHVRVRHLPLAAAHQRGQGHQLGGSLLRLQPPGRQELQYFFIKKLTDSLCV